MFTLNQDYSITCRFSFFEQYQNVQVISYKPGLSNDFALTQRKLSKLSFHYNIPFSNLSFSVKQTTTKFVFNGTYNEFITDNGTNYRNFIIRNPILFKPLIPQPLFSSVSSAPSTPAGPSMPSLPSYEVIHSSRPNREVSSHHAMNAMDNVNRLRDAAVITGGLTINPNTFMQRVSSNSTWTNKDLMLLLLAVNGIITSEIPDEIEDQTIDQSILHNDDLVSE